MPEDIKKETIDNETAENKAEEIEIEGADEESTQTAEETKDAKDTDVNETESLKYDVLISSEVEGFAMQKNSTPITSKITTAPIKIPILVLD